MKGSACISAWPDADVEGPIVPLGSLVQAVRIAHEGRAPLHGRSLCLNPAIIECL